MSRQLKITFQSILNQQLMLNKVKSIIFKDRHAQLKLTSNIKSLNMILFQVVSKKQKLVLARVPRIHWTKIKALIKTLINTMSFLFKALKQQNRSNSTTLVLEIRSTLLPTLSNLNLLLLIANYNANLCLLKLWIQSRNVCSKPLNNSCSLQNH